MKTQVSSVPFGGAELKRWGSPSSVAPCKAWKPVLRLVVVLEPYVREPSRVSRVEDVRRTGGYSLFERERSLGDLPDEVGRGLGILSETTAPTRIV